MQAVWIPDGIRLAHGPRELCVDIAHTFGILQQCVMTCIRRFCAVLDIDGPCCMLAHDIRPKVARNRDVSECLRYDCVASVGRLGFSMSTRFLFPTKRVVHTQHPV